MRQRNSDEALFSPCSAPGIFDGDIVATLIITVANGKNSVSILCVTRIRVNYSSFVITKGLRISIDSNSNWSQEQCGLKLLGILTNDFVDLFSSDLHASWIIFTSRLLLSIRVIVPLVETVLGCIFHGIVSEASFTAEVAPCVI